MQHVHEVYRHDICVFPATPVSWITTTGRACRVTRRETPMPVKGYLRYVRSRAPCQPCVAQTYGRVRGARQRAISQLNSGLRSA